MPSKTSKISGAEGRFREALKRLKSGQTKLVPPGSPVSQNNVAREANCDPSALKKSRFPELVREIQAYVELHQDNDQVSARQISMQRRAANRSLREQLRDTQHQRDHAQSILTSANARIIELSLEVQLLQQRLDELQPPPINLGKHSLD